MPSLSYPSRLLQTKITHKDASLRQLTFGVIIYLSLWTKLIGTLVPKFLSAVNNRFFPSNLKESDSNSTVFGTERVLFQLCTDSILILSTISDDFDEPEICSSLFDSSLVILRSSFCVGSEVRSTVADQVVGVIISCEVEQGWKRRERLLRWVGRSNSGEKGNPAILIIFCFFKSLGKILQFECALAETSPFYTAENFENIRESNEEYSRI